MYKIDLTKSGTRFSKKEKLFRIAWNLAWMLVKYLPRQFSNLRIIVLKLFGAKIGKQCLIESGVQIWLPNKLDLADYVAIGRKTEVYNYDLITIGSMTVISQYCYLICGTHDYEAYNMPLTWDKITIGSEVWIAAGTWIMPGVSIENGIVVGARSLVTKDLKEQWFVYAGHPCVKIKKRELTK
jgi:putative colanic acid biosynthesis acetyltransferase WcaF